MLTIPALISSKLLAAMRTFVIEKMWNQARKCYHSANIKGGLPDICQQHNYDAAIHQHISNFPGLLYCHFTHSVTSAASDLFYLIPDKLEVCQMPVILDNSIPSKLPTKPSTNFQFYDCSYSNYTIKLVNNSTVILEHMRKVRTVFCPDFLAQS